MPPFTAPERPTIAAVCIGDELMDGRVGDVNAKELGALCRERGWTLAEVVFVADNPADIERSVRSLGARYRHVVTSGGLGPTLDDRTRAALAAATDRPLVVDPIAEARLAQKALERQARTTAIGNRQALVPEGARIIPSSVGTADPFSVGGDGFTLVALPGVPREFSALVAVALDGVLPEAAPRAVARFHLAGCRESVAAARIEELDLPSSVEVTYCAATGEVAIEVCGDDQDDLDRAAVLVERAVRFWSLPSGLTSTAEAVVAGFSAAGARFAIVESCTGGLATARIVDLPGASAVLDRSWVTYSDAAKSAELGVSVALLEAHGAVSAPVAAAMARGAQARSGADVAVSITGISGPAGGTEAKPVGTVYLAVTGARGGAVVLARFLGRSRTECRVLAAGLAHRLLLCGLAGDYEAVSHQLGVEHVDLAS